MTTVPDGTASVRETSLTDFLLARIAEVRVDEGRVLAFAEVSGGTCVAAVYSDHPGYREEWRP